MSNQPEKIAILAGPEENAACIGFANSGYGMDEKWWADVLNARDNGCLWGVYKDGDKLVAVTF